MKLRFYKINDYLFSIFIFFIPFTGTAVLNIEAISFGLQPSYLILLINMYALLLYLLMNSNSYIGGVIKEKPLIIFFLILIMNIASSFQGFYAPLSKNDIETPVIVGLKSSAYYAFFLLSLITILYQTRKRDNFIKYINIYYCSCLFPLFWGTFQLFCFFCNKEYPLIFNNNISSAQNVDFCIGKIFLRVCSVAQEPSMFALFLVTILAISGYFILENKTISGKKIIDLIIFITTIIMLFFTSSISGFASFALILILLIIFSKNRIMFLKLIVVTLIVTNTSVLFLSKITDGTNYLSVIFERLDRISILSDNSASTRTDHLIAGLKVFLDHPIIGVGEKHYGFFSSSYSTIEGKRPFPITHNFIASVLAEHGIIGVILWFSFFFSIYYPSIKKVNKMSDSILKRYSIAIIVASIVSNFAILMFQNCLLFLQFFFLNGMVVNIRHVHTHIHNNLFYSDNYSPIHSYQLHATRQCH